MTDPAHIVLFLVYFSASVLLLLAFLAAYTLITPIQEWRQIRAGNTAVSIALGGAMIGFALPLASAIVHTQSLVEAVITAAIALAVQLGCFTAMRLLRRDAAQALADGDMAEGVFLGALSVVLGLLNAACLS